jgi:hypothetical protein
MCEDECDGTPSHCAGLLAGFTCAPADTFCQPPPSTACVPASNYQHGTKPYGACCSATGDATAGRECLSGVCVSFDEGSSAGPFMCTVACETPGCCPASTQATPQASYYLCAPTAVYSCQ